MARLKKKAPAKKKKSRRRELEERPSPAWKRLTAEPWWEKEKDLVEFELTATTKGGTPSARRER